MRRHDELVARRLDRDACCQREGRERLVVEHGDAVDGVAHIVLRLVDGAFGIEPAAPRVERGVVEEPPVVEHDRAAKHAAVDRACVFDGHGCARRVDLAGDDAALVDEHGRGRRLREDRHRRRADASVGRAAIRVGARAARRELRADVRIGDRHARV